MFFQANRFNGDNQICSLDTLFLRPSADLNQNWVQEFSEIL